MKIMKTGLTISGIVLVLALSVGYLFMSISINDDANTRKETIDGMKSKVEVSLDNMKKVLDGQVKVTKGEKDAFLEFQRLVAESKKGQSIGGIMTSIQEKYPNFDIKGFEKLLSSIEIKRDEFSIVQNQYNSHVTEYNKFIVKTVNKFFLDDTHKKMEQFVISSKEAKQSMVSGEDEQTDISF